MNQNRTSLKHEATVIVCDPSTSTFDCSFTCGDNLKKSDIDDFFCCTPLCKNSLIPTLLIVEVTIHTPDNQKKLQTPINSGSSLSLISKEVPSLLPNN
jgi:hypothetical protein